MTENEKSTFEQEIRNKILEEQRAKRRAYRAKWRENNREHIRNYDRAYYKLRKKQGVQVNEERSD